MFARWEYEAILRAARQHSLDAMKRNDEMDRAVICIAPGIDRLLLIRASYEAT